jgi:hypothetical protein
MSMDLPGLSFGWGPGPGDRMLAPGLPDALFCDGSHLGWINRDGAWRLNGNRVEFVPVSYPVGVTVCAAGWTLVRATEGGWCVHRIDWRQGTVSQTELAGRGVLAGWSWATVDLGLERRLIDLENPAAPRPPAGARDAHSRPWSDSPGLIWITDKTVYRMGPDLRVRVAGSLPATPLSWIAGPAGAAVFALDGAAWGSAPRGGLVRLPDIDVGTSRFSPDGHRLLAIHDEGIVEVDLIRGDICQEKRGAFTPVGYAESPVVMEETTGAVRTLSGHTLAEGFSPCASALDDAHLYGPGGTAWDLEAGVSLWSHAPLRGEHIAVVGDSIVSVAAEVEVFDHTGERSRHFPLPLDPDSEGPVYDIRPDPPDHVLIELEDEAVRIRLDGHRIGAVQPILLEEADEPQRLESDGSAWTCCVDIPAVIRQRDDGGPRTSWPIYAESVVVIGHRAWCWNEDGMLIALDLGATTRR